jgi:hypothetical protein
MFRKSGLRCRASLRARDAQRLHLRSRASYPYSPCRLRRVGVSGGLRARLTKCAVRGPFRTGIESGVPSAVCRSDVGVASARRQGFQGLSPIRILARDLLQRDYVEVMPAAGPYPCHQRVLADDRPARLDQRHQDIECTAAELNRLSVSNHFAAMRQHPEPPEPNARW